MAATLIAVIFALALGHLAPGLAGAVRQHGLYTHWLRWLGSVFPGPGGPWHGRAGVLIALLPPVLLVALLQYALHSPLLGILGLLFGLAVLFFAWGPRDLDADVAAIIDAEHADARREAIVRLGADPARGGEGATMIDAVFASALRRWFGVLFWFLLLGAAGALLYRLAALGTQGEAREALPPAARDGAARLHALLDWPVAQAMSLSLALVGNFDTVLAAWREAGGASLRLDNAFLGAAGRASVRSEIAEETSELIEEGVAPGNAWVQLGELPELRDAMSLVWRVLLLWLAILALFVVAGWVN
jgi:AmpE protein